MPSVWGISSPCHPWVLCTQSKLLNVPSSLSLDKLLGHGAMKNGELLALQPQGISQTPWGEPGRFHRMGLWVFRVRGKFATQLSSKMPPNRPRETTGPKRRGLGRSAVMMGVSVLQSLARSSLCRDVEAKVRRAGLHVAGLGGHDNARN